MGNMNLGQLSCLTLGKLGVNWKSDVRSCRPINSCLHDIGLLALVQFNMLPVEASWHI